MQNRAPQVTAEDSVASLLPLMADGDVDAVPVLDGKRIVGIATRTDLVAGLTRMAARVDDDASRAIAPAAP
jgi:CBS domain-containing membrane protein